MKLPPPLRRLNPLEAAYQLRELEKRADCGLAGRCIHQHGTVPCNHQPDSDQEVRHG